MRNKGRRHKAGHNEKMSGIANCKGIMVIATRPIESMSSRELYKWKKAGSGKYFKRKWSKRVRGYFKSQTKDLLDPE